MVLTTGEIERVTFIKGFFAFKNSNSDLIA
jgi:hypothetical protein